MAYNTVAQTHTRTEHVKGSRFIVRVAEAKSLEAVEACLREVRAEHPDASHHCYAYRLAEQMRFSDDGEPGGTAGRPMLEVLLKRDLDFVVAVVSRYFGGTKLGAGGLVRAYSGSLAKALDEAGVREVRDYVTLAFEVAFAQMDTVYRLLDGWEALSRGEPDFSSNGMQLTVTLLVADLDRFKETLDEYCQGSVHWL